VAKFSGFLFYRVGLSQFICHGYVVSCEHFLHAQTTTGVVLMFMTVLALILANSPLAEAYASFFHTEIILRLYHYHQYSSAEPPLKGIKNITMKQNGADGESRTRTSVAHYPKTNDVLSIDVPIIDSKTNDVLSTDVPTIDSKTNDVLSTDVPTIDSKTPHC
jgi:hypothetical protein